MKILRIDKENGKSSQLTLINALERICKHYGNYPQIKKLFKKKLLIGETIETDFAIYKLNETK